MSCTDPILSFDAIVRRAARYADGCGAMAVGEGTEGDAFACTSADLPDLVALAMAFDDGADVLRVVTTNVTLAALCSGYDVAMECDGLTAAQAFRAALTVDGSTAVIRVLYITDTTEGCLECSKAEIALEAMVGATVVTDGTDTYILAMAPDVELTDALACADAEVSGTALTRSALTPIGDCGMWAWRVAYEALDAGCCTEDPMTVTGSDILTLNGAYTDDGTANGKPAFIEGDNTLQWTANSTWYLQDSNGNGYASDEDVDCPCEVTQWYETVDGIAANFGDPAPEGFTVCGACP